MAAKFVVVLSLLVTFVYAKVLGGWNVIDADNEHVRKVANFAANQIDMKTNSRLRSKLVKVAHAERQLVSGWNYKLVFDLGITDCEKSDSSKKLEDCVVDQGQITECTVEVWVREWIDSYDLKKDHCVPKSSPKKMLVGGIQKADVNRKDINEAATFAVEKLNQGTNSLYRGVLTEIVRATTQVVAGVKYGLVLKIGLSQCRNNEEHARATLQTCKLQEPNEITTCKVSVVHQPWQSSQFAFVLHDWKCDGQRFGSSDKMGRAKRKQRSAPFQNPNADAQMDMGSMQKSKLLHALDGFLVHGEPIHLKDQPILGGDDHDIGHYGDFLEFKKKYSKQYKDNSEEKMRFKIFHDNMVKARDYEREDRGTARYGATEFADMTEEEFRKTHLNPVWDTSYDPNLKPAKIPNGPIPKEWDWREHGAVTEVKNQGSCGSCWAFSTTGNIEGQWALKKKNLVSLSEQELVDCDKVDEGCNGGLPSQAYQAIMKIGGLETEKEYPYKGVDSRCHYDKTQYKVYINSSVNISSNEADMAAWLYQNGPISIGINAFAMQFYMGGIAHPWRIFCNPKSLDHGVLIAGYGVKGSTPYWIVKNSWGKSWGVEGYYLVYRGDGVCGLNTMCTSSVVN